MATLVLAGELAVDPYRRKVVHGAKTQADLLSIPTPRQIEAGLVPGKTKIVAHIDKLVIPTRRHRNWPAGTKPAAPTLMLAHTFRIDAEVPDAGQIDQLAKWVRLRIQHRPAPCSPMQEMRTDYELTLRSTTPSPRDSGR